MEIWITENQTHNLGLSCRIKETLHVERSEYQDIAVVDSYQFGRMLVLDGVYQTSIAEEYIYHEMIAHVPLYTHPNPKKVLVIGGGDGGTVREVLKHPTVEYVKMVEIDGAVVNAAKKYLPEISKALIENPPQLDLTIGDGIAHMASVDSEYDVIIVDCSDPIGPGEGLFTYQFYKDVYKALKPDGIFVQQTESPLYHQPLVQRINKDVKNIFPITKLYLVHIPIYPGGMHCFTFGSKKYNPLETEIKTLPEGLRYYNQDMHKACFALPNFVKTLINE